MTWLVFGVSCLLVLAGAVSITSGAPIIQLERGWAEVIAGSVAMSSGGVVFALGVILVRLEGLREAVTSSAAPSPSTLAVVANAAALPAMTVADAMPAAAPASVDTTTDESPPAAPADAMLPLSVTPDEAPTTAPEPRSDQGLWKSIKRPAEKVDAALEAQGFPDRVASDRPAGEPKGPVVAFSPPEATRATVREVPLSAPREPDASASDDAGQLGWLERSLFKGRANKERDAETRELATKGERIEPAMGSVVREPASVRLEPVVGALQAEAPAIEAAPSIVPTDDGPTVIGRYQAGVASYVMYSDGTIEVETEGGQSHRFGSMDELKAFIANQDSPGA